MANKRARTGSNQNPGPTGRRSSYQTDSSVGGLQANFRDVLGIAAVEAANRGSAMIEAEHLLLAFLFDRHGAGATILADCGVTYETFSQALQLEQEHTLAAIGITLPHITRFEATPRIRSGRPRFGASAKDAWHRAAKARQPRRGRRWLDIDLLAGIVSAKLGTVPRALTRGGFDQQQLLSALHTAHHSTPHGHC